MTAACPSRLSLRPVIGFGLAQTYLAADSRWTNALGSYKDRVEIGSTGWQLISVRFGCSKCVRLHDLLISLQPFWLDRGIGRYRIRI